MTRFNMFDCKTYKNEREIMSLNVKDLENISAVQLDPKIAKLYIVDMLEELMLIAQGAQLNHLSNGLDTLLEPYRD